MVGCPLFPVEIPQSNANQSGLRLRAPFGGLPIVPCRDPQSISNQSGLRLRAPYMVGPQAQCLCAIKYAYPAACDPNRWIMVVVGSLSLSNNLPQNHALPCMPSERDPPFSFPPPPQKKIKIGKPPICIIRDSFTESVYSSNF